MDSTAEAEQPTIEMGRQSARRRNPIGSVPWQSLRKTRAGKSPSPAIENQVLFAQAKISKSILGNSTPIHERPIIANPQTNSPLFNGRIPPEIREAIFEYALTEYTKTDPKSQYAVSTNYTRPGYTGQRMVNISLLLTCRLAYLETYHLPPSNKEHVFWHARWPPGADQDKWGDREHESRYFERFQPWQMDLVKEIHFFTQLFWLEHTFPDFCRKNFLQGMERVKITIRRGDWWWNERNASLEINPQRGHSSQAGLMLSDWAAEKNGRVIPWDPSGWGCAFGRLKSLKELTMEFETSEDKKDELMAIVEKAKTWRFPLKEGAVLITGGTNATIRTWETPKIYWSDYCPYCASPNTCRKVDPPNEGCVKREKLRAENKGPLCYIASLKWKKVNGGR